jgi:hypothetical protein
MVYLYIWMIVAANGRGDASFYTHTHYGWVNSGEYRSAESCHEAAKLLNIIANARCVPK